MEDANRNWNYIIMCVYHGVVGELACTEIYFLMLDNQMVYKYVTCL